MEERSRRTLFCAPRGVGRKLWGCALALTITLAACVGRHAGPRTLASIGGLMVAGGSASWAAGEGLGGDAHDATARALTSGGFIGVAVGLAAVVAAGGWMAASVGCQADPDCPEEETCREIPAPPGGVPYKQCVPRR